LEQLAAGPYSPPAGWDDPTVLENCEAVASAGFAGKTLALACVAVDLLSDRQPDTVRGVMYAVVSAGWLPDTSPKSYGRVQRILNVLRKRRIIPTKWIVDNIRETDKPSSWSGLEDFADTVAGAYRKDFWSSLSDYVTIIVEKDTVAGRILQVTRKYDVALHPLRGFSSTTFTYGIADEWNRIDKPIHAYYIGDHDPSGREIERSIRNSLTELVDDPFTWTRLAVEPHQFETYNVIALEPKKRDSRYRRFTEQFGDRCAEVEAVPADALRAMVEDAITRHIPAGQWDRMKQIEAEEKQSFNAVLEKMRGAA